MAKKRAPTNDGGRVWLYSDAEHLNERVSRAVVRCLDGYSYFGGGDDEQKVTLDYHLVPLPPQEPSDYDNDMDYLGKKDSRTGIEPYWNHGVHVPNKSLICVSEESESGFALQLPIAHGTVVGYSPPLNEGAEDDEQLTEGEFPTFEFETNRQKDNEALFRILWDGSSSGIGYVEDVTLKELLPCLDSKRKKNQVTPLPKDLLQANALAVHKSVRAVLIRKKLSIEWKMENEIMPRLVVLAGLELRREVGQRVRLEMLLERRRLRAAAEGRAGDDGKKNRSGDKEINADGNAFEYYLKHPNQYMSSFQPPPPLPSDDEGDEDDNETEYTKPRSKTKLTKAELVKYNEKVDEQCHFAPSKLAERVKLACSLAFNYASRNGLLDEYFVESERRKERERVSREEMDKAPRNGGVSRWAAADDGEVRRSSRARNSVNYADDGAQAVESILDEHEGIGKAKASVGKASDASSDFPRSEISGGPTAIYLLEMLGWNYNEESGASKSPEDDDGDDPFFEPDRCLVIDQLGRKQRFMSPANIQDAIVRSIEGEPTETPKSLLDEEQVEEMECGGGFYVSDIHCTSDDKVDDLPQFEPASFARCRFATRTFIPEPEEVDEEEHEEDTEVDVEAEKLAKAEAKKQKEERQKIRLAAEQKRNAKLEQQYRSRKAFELWRFKSIHGNGCTVWPSWSDRSKSLLKDLFVMSRVNSTIDLVASAQPITEPAASMEPTSESSASKVQPTQSDEALARSLAAAENAVDDSEPLAKRRRTTRRAAGGDEPVFYGSYQSMSREQLFSTLVRLLRQAKPGSSSIMDLKQLVFATDYESSRGEVVEWRKLRSVLGHLVFRLGQVGRLIVDVDSDAACWDMLKEGALVKFTAESELKDAATNPPADASAGATISNSPLPIDSHLAEKLSALENYVQDLHLTELSLRTALMKAIDKGGQSGESILQISTLAIATAADETEGDASAEDWKFFTADDENKEEITWKNSDHALVGQILYRPSSPPLIPSDAKPGLGEKCQWYKVVSYTPSVKGEDTASEDGKQSQDPHAFEPNPLVARRMRFRAVPIAACDIDADPKMDIDDNEANDVDFMVLTESQVRAGMEAAVLHRRISASNRSEKNSGFKSASVHMHPFKNKTGSRVMLTPDTNDVIYGVIAGHDHWVQNKTVFHKVLILLDQEDEDGRDGGPSFRNSTAFWSTVNSDGTLLTDIASGTENSPPLCSSYKIDMHEFFQGSEAYNACESVLIYLKNQKRAAPFSVPVDPVALGLPDYFDVIKSPMDLSTLERNLEEGKYSRIPPRSEDEDDNPAADHPVYRMVYGSFYDDLMLIFDNCTLYNTADSWIGKEAEWLKKNAIRKADQIVHKATSSWYRQESKSASTKKSLYADEDSDVDMYEYESDYDDEDGKPKSRKGGAKKAAKPRVEDDIPSKAIEKPYMMPGSAGHFNASSSFPHMKIQTNVGRFSLPQDWSCRHTSSSSDDNDPEVNENGIDKEEEEMLSLLKMQQEQEDESNIRRSSRARSAPKNYGADDEMVIVTKTAPLPEPISLPGVEYYIVHDNCFQLYSESSIEQKLSSANPTKAVCDTIALLPTASKSRLGVEGVRETLHEQFYAKLYRLHSPNAMILDNELGKYADGSFPPYLGRVFDVGTDERGSIVWEIREQYVIPALRWVLRGLVRSGHLAEVDGSLSEGVSADNDGSTGPRAGAAFTFGPGVVVPNHEYFFNEQFEPFEVLDEKEIMRKRRVQAGDGGAESSEEEEVELSAYEKMRAERVARNAERLKALGLA